MSYFKAHQIWFQLGGLCPRSHWGTLQHSSDLGGFQAAYTSKKREEKGRKEQGESGCTVQGRIRLCYGNTVVTEIDSFKLDPRPPALWVSAVRLIRPIFCLCTVLSQNYSVY